MEFELEKTFIEGLIVITPKFFQDDRGYFAEIYNKRDMSDIGINCEFVQDNISKSKYGVMRGLHFQIKKPQAKLVKVIRGEVFDVAVDLRMNSKTFGKWYGIKLSAENQKSFFIPEGFAHGFLSLKEDTVFSYKTSDFYDRNDERGITWQDKTLNIEWPNIHDKLIISEKDSNLPSFSEMVDGLKN